MLPCDAMSPDLNNAPKHTTYPPKAPTTAPIRHDPTNRIIHTTLGMIAYRQRDNHGCGPALPPIAVLTEHFLVCSTHSGAEAAGWASNNPKKIPHLPPTSLPAHEKAPPDRRGFSIHHGQRMLAAVRDARARQRQHYL